MQFEWDPAKNAANIAKHGIAFEQAAEIFAGITISRADLRLAYGEQREISIGRTGALLVIVVVHTDRNGKRRIISARRANRKERMRYDSET